MVKNLLLVFFAIGSVDCGAMEKVVQKDPPNSVQEFLNSLPENKRSMLEKYQNEQKEIASTILKTRKLPEVNTDQYEIFSFLSREYQMFYVQDVLLSEDGKHLGIFFSELGLDEKGNWKINPVLKRIIPLEDLENAKKKPRFKYTKTKDMGDFIEPSEAEDLKRYSRFMQDIFKEEEQRKEAQTKVLIKIREKGKSPTNPQ